MTNNWFGRFLAVGLNLLLAGNVFYLVWTDKLSAVLAFLVALLWLTRVPAEEKLGLSLAQIQLYVLFPLVYLLSSVGDLTSRVIVAVLYLPIVVKIVPGILEQVYEEEWRAAAYTNLIYLYFSPVILLQEVRVAYAVLAVYALVYVFGWEKYVLRPIPLWERVVHLVGLSAVLLLMSVAG